MSSTSVDFYRFDHNLGDEERNVRDTVRAFVDRSFLPVVREHFAAGTFPWTWCPSWAPWACWEPRSRARAAPA